MRNDDDVVRYLMIIFLPILAALFLPSRSLSPDTAFPDLRDAPASFYEEYEMAPPRSDLEEFLGSALDISVKQVLALRKVGLGWRFVARPMEDALLKPRRDKPGVP